VFHRSLMPRRLIRRCVSVGLMGKSCRLTQTPGCKIFAGLRPTRPSALALAFHKAAVASNDFGSI